MADENEKQIETESRPWHQTVTLLLVSLRLAALVATATAAGLMAFNKETKTISVVVVGTNPILQSFTAAFQQTPAFVYFVLANAIASLYNLLAILLRPCLKNIGRQVLVHLLQLRSGPLKLWAQGRRPVPPSSRAGPAQALLSSSRMSSDLPMVGS
ncbi:hypothetical protein ZIOFF_035089 [Zingiber officinale]|uniref:CASP-like protein n=1 Tax=Zingiber officinale TaxID=94328 RepID=A0A8J5GB68_ZINOF|nr:hypothetical protein ZIOFF_035089 [Zingiber officinale]